MDEMPELTVQDLTHFRRCVELAREALADGDEWRRDWGVVAGPVSPLPIGAVAPGIAVTGPALELVEELRELHKRAADQTVAS